MSSKQGVIDTDVLFGNISSNTDLFGEDIEIDESTDNKEGSELEVDVKDNVDLFGEELDSEEAKEAVDVENADEKVKEVEEKVDATTTEINFLERAKELVRLGIWEDVEELDEVEELSEEDYEDLKKQQQEYQREKVKEEVLADLDEDEKEFLEFKKNGGNLEKYTMSLLNKQRAQQLDITTPQGKKAAIYSYYTNVVGWSAERTQKHIGRLEQAKELDEEAEMSYDEITKITKEQHESLVQVQKDAETERQRKRDEFIRSTKSTLKDNGLDTKKINQVMKNVSELDESGFTEIDKAFLSFRNDPTKIKALHDFLLDHENFEKTVAQKKVNEEKLNIAKKFKIRTRKDTDVVEQTSTKAKYIEL